MKEESKWYSKITQFYAVLLLLFMDIFRIRSNGSKQTGLSTIKADKNRAIQVSHRRENYTAPQHRRREKREKTAKLQVKQRGGKNEEKMEGSQWTGEKAEFVRREEREEQEGQRGTKSDQTNTVYTELIWRQRRWKETRGKNQTP